MARRRRDRHTRDVSTISRAPSRSAVDILELLSEPVSVHRVPDRTVLQEVEDRREFDPEVVSRPARAFRRSAARVVAPTGTRFPDTVPASVGFRVPDKVAVCVRRHQRKEVLFAKRKAGRGGRKRDARWSEFSDVRC